MDRDRKDSKGHKGSTRSLLRPIVFYFLLAYGGVVLTGIGIILWFSATIPLAMLRERKAWRWITICLLLNPMVFYFAGTCIDYSQGMAYFKTAGRPTAESYNLDPSVRCFWRTSGCFDHGGLVEQLPNYLALKLMGTLFGPMPGSYDGEYPTSQEAILAIRSAGPLSVETLESNRIPLPDGSATVHLAKELGTHLALHSQAELFDPDEEGGFPSPRIARIGQCLLIGIPHVEDRYRFYDKPPGEKDINWVITLFDIETGQGFAWYSTGNFPHWFPMFYSQG